MGLGQRDCAELLAVPLETLRTWDSGRRPIPSHIVQRAKDLLVRQRRETELLPLALWLANWACIYGLYKPPLVPDDS